MQRIPKTTELFSLDRSITKKLLSGCEYPHLALDKIEDFITRWAQELPRGYKEIKPGAFVHESARIWEGVVLGGSCIIGAGTELRPGAFIRGGVIVGENAVIGNSTEVKNSIIFDGAQLPHYNYVGDSIIGYKAHMGAGAIASNLRLDKGEVVIRTKDEGLPTGRRKVGAILGDGAEIGCGCVICPGAVIGRGAVVYPLCRVMGVLPENSVFKGEVN